MNKDFWNIVCLSTNEIFPLETQQWKSSTGSLLQLTHALRFSPDMIDTSVQSLWRYKAMLPVFSEQAIVSFGEGMTPIVKTKINGHMHECGLNKLVEDSSGNAGAAIATYAAKAGIKSEIVVSENTSANKIKQLEMLGAEVIKIAGTREDVAEEAIRRAKDTYYASHCYNPFFFQGTKTFAYELWEQTGGKLPEEIFFPVGNGTLILGCFLGFMELMEAGLIDYLPRLTAVQAENCASLLHNDTERMCHTVADGIAIKKPVRKAEILNAVRYTKGQIICVTEKEILSAWQMLAGMGFYVEKTWIKNNASDNALIPLTGHGLKIG